MANTMTRSLPSLCRLLCAMFVPATGGTVKQRSSVLVHLLPSSRLSP